MIRRGPPGRIRPLGDPSSDPRHRDHPSHDEAWLELAAALGREVARAEMAVMRDPDHPGLDETLLEQARALVREMADQGLSDPDFDRAVAVLSDRSAQRCPKGALNSDAKKP